MRDDTRKTAKEITEVTIDGVSTISTTVVTSSAERVIADSPGSRYTCTLNSLANFLSKEQNLCIG